MSEYYQRIDEALAEHIMPKEYSDMYSEIYCNDCEKRSYAKYHFLYHKCGHCSAYNSKVILTTKELPVDAIIATALVSTRLLNSQPATRISLETSGSEASISPVVSIQSNSDSSASSSSSSSLHPIWCHYCQVF
jgi:hypothetical protein